jgi:hypothetical protein
MLSLRIWGGQAAVDRTGENDQLKVELLRTGMATRRAVQALDGRLTLPSFQPRVLLVDYENAPTSMYDLCAGELLECLE